VFNFIKKKGNFDSVLAPVSGTCIDISDVNDGVFSQKILGDGFAIKPDSNIICAPCSGELSMMFVTGHAFGIKTKSGLEILVHIGIDTINLKGGGFKILKNKNSQIDAGEPIIEIKREEMADKGYDLVTIVIITSQIDVGFVKYNLNQHVSKGEHIIQFEKGN
jgi:glucose-specific phosphotransferase system IIA component